MLQPAAAYNSRLSAPVLERPSAAPESGGEQSLHLKRLQFESLARHASRLPVLIPLVATLVGFIAWESAPRALIVGWIVAVTAIPVVRWQYSLHALEEADLRLDHALRMMMVLSFCNGVIQGGGIALFFPGLTLIEKAIVTMVMVCLSAGAVSANAGYSRSFYAWAVPMFGALGAAWIMQGDLAGTWIGLLLMLFPVAEAVFVRDNERVLRESFEIRYQNEKLIRELEQERLAKSRFLASASHDLRQPLHTLSLYSAALGMHKTDDRTQEMAAEIGNAIASLGSLLDGLLDISKLDADAVRPEPVRFSLTSLLARIAADFRPVAAAKGVGLELEVGAPVHVETDAVLLERVLRNLVENAVKYTARGKVGLKLRTERGRAVILVADTGSGIPREEHERVFEEFFQLNNPERDRTRGIGLGLAIVKRLTDLLDIQLALDSAPGHGTTVALTLPVSQPLAEDAKAAQSSHVAALPRGIRVLVVDDEGNVRGAMLAVLEGLGCMVTLASGTAEALQALDQDEFDLIIADQRLRGSETGVELIRRAREKAGDIPALIVTGDTAAEIAAKAAEHGVTVLHKPVFDSKLRGAIAAAVQGKVR